MTRPEWSRALLGLLLLVGPLGCTIWRKDDQVLLAPIPERKPVQIYAGTGEVVAHSVRVDSTTLSYVLRITPPDCDSCRRTIPLASIDSVRTSAVSAPRTIVLLSVITLFGWWGSHFPSD